MFFLYSAQLGHQSCREFVNICTISYDGNKYPGKFACCAYSLTGLLVFMFT